MKYITDNFQLSVTVFFSQCSAIVRKKKNSEKNEYTRQETKQVQMHSTDEYICTCLGPTFVYM